MKPLLLLPVDLIHLMTATNNEKMADLGVSIVENQDTPKKHTGNCMESLADWTSEGGNQGNQLAFESHGLVTTGEE